MYNFSLILQQFVNYLSDKYSIKSLIKASIPSGSNLRNSHILVDFVDFIYSDFQNKGVTVKIRISLEIIILDTLGIKHLNGFMNMIYNIRSKTYLQNEFEIQENYYASILNIQKDNKLNIYYLDIELSQGFDNLKELY